MKQLSHDLCKPVVNDRSPAPFYKGSYELKTQEVGMTYLTQMLFT